MDKCPKCGKSDQFEEMFYDGDVENVTLKKGEYGVCHRCKNMFPKNEVYSRVCGYLRPIRQFNKGKKQEFNDRVDYDINKDIENA